MRKAEDAFGNPSIVPEVSFVAYQSADEWVVETSRNGMPYRNITTHRSTSQVADWIKGVLDDEEQLW